MKQRIVKGLVLWFATLCFLASAHAASSRITKIVLINKGRQVSLAVSTYGPLMVKASTSQVGMKRGTTALIRNVIITVARKEGPLHLTAERAAVETRFVQVELKADAELGYSNVLSTFVTALKNFPLVPRFHTYWSFTAGFGVAQYYDVLYNRRLGMMRSSTYYDDENPMMNCFLYSHVTDRVLQRNYSWCKKYNGDEGTFSTIPYFGAVQRKAHSRRIVGK